MSRPVDPSKTATTHRSLKKTSSHKSTSTAPTSVQNATQSNSRDHGGQSTDNSTFHDPLLGVGGQFGAQGRHPVRHQLSTSDLFSVCHEKKKSHSPSKGNKSKCRHNPKKSNTNAMEV